MKKYLSLLISIIICLVTPKIGMTLEVNTILEKIQETLTVKQDFSAKMTMVEHKPGQGEKSHKLAYYRRDADDAFLLVVTHPSIKKGNGYLRVGDNFWAYRRNTRSFQHVNRNESIAGTDMKVEAFEKQKLTDLYQSEKNDKGQDIIDEDRLGNIPVYRFPLIAKAKDVVYPKQIMWVRQDNFLPLKIEQFSVSGTHMLTNLYLKYTKINDQYFWVKLLSIDEFEKGNKTVADISGISLKPIDNIVFTKAYLESLSN